MSEKPMVTDAFIRRYRPQTLDEMVGQEAAVKVVRGFLKTGKIPQTILITGESSAGKTTLSRIIAAAVNGYKGDTEQNPNLQEVNIGDKRTIDDIRDIIANSRYLPPGKFKVILLDEFHRLPVAAASPLLKPLEEPHKHLIWILCTNEPEKLLPTILGRCLSIRLQSLKPETLIPLLQRVCRGEKINFGPKHERILRTIAETGQGQPRTTLNLLQNTANAFAVDGDAKQALSQAIQTLDGHQIGEVTLKVLYGMYLGKPLAVLSALADTEDYQGLINIGMELNRYLFDLHTKTQNTYHSPQRQRLARLLAKKFNDEIPPLETVLIVQEALVNTRERMNTYMVSEKSLVQVTLPKVAQIIGGTK